VSVDEAARQAEIGTDPATQPDEAKQAKEAKDREAA
jgi:hypothetical protein